MKLAEYPEWHALLHYRTTLLIGDVESEADDPNFFASPEGKTDSEAELEAYFLHRRNGINGGQTMVF